MTDFWQMQTSLVLRCVQRVLLPVLLLMIGALVQASTVTFNASGTWTAPAGVTSVTVEAWGGGGAGGGQNLGSDGGGGGGGGAYSKIVSLPVTPGNNYTVTVGAGGIGVSGGNGGAGGDSYFLNTSTVLAKGGAGGLRSTGTPPAGVAGGAAAAGVGTTKFSGGNGGAGRDSSTGRGGPGGSSAGTAANGTNGPAVWSTLTAAAAPAGGGIGGNGGDSGSNGFAPGSGRGGGGGGSGEGSPRLGGDGAAGQVVLTYVGAPIVVTDPATGVTASDATLNGVVSSDGAATTVTFEYGLTAAYGSTVTAVGSPLAPGATNAPVSATISGLTAGTVYHFRVKGVNSTGTTDGADRTFTTLPPPSPTLSKTVSAASASLNDVVTFTLTLSNPTPAALSGVTVNDTLPTGMLYVTHVASAGTLTQVGQALTWTIPSVPAGESVTLTLAIQLTQSGVLTNTATSSVAPSASASVLVVAGAVTHFRLDEPVGSWTGAPGEVLDTGTTGLHGQRLITTSPTTTNVVAPSPTIASQHPSVVGGFCNAAQFDGNAVVQVADSPLFDYTTTLSASAWIYPTAYPPSELYSVLSNDVNYEFHLNSAGRLYWWWNAATLTSAATIPLNQWTHIAITFNSATGRQRIYINGVQDSNTNNWTGTLQVNACNFYIGGDVATGSCALLPARNFRGKIDEVKLYNTELSAAEVQANMTLGRQCAGNFDHIQIEHDGSASMCTPESVTVKACLDASCSTLYPGAVTVQLSPSGWIGGNTFTFTGGIASRQLSSSVAGNVTLGTVSASPLPVGSTRCFMGATESCTLNFANASCNFDAVEPSAAPQTRLFTKLADVPFNVDVLALSSATTINTAYTGTVAVDLVDASSSSCPAGGGLTTATNIVFSGADSGRKQVPFTYSNGAANVRVRMKAGSSAAACSTDNFAIRPKQLTVSAPVLTNTTHTGTPKAVAGTAFALDANAGVAAGYSGTAPVIDVTKVLDHANVTIAGGTLSGVFSAGTGTKASGAGFKYLDVGNIKFLTDAVVDSGFTSVDQPNDCVAGSTSITLAGGKYGCNIGSATSPLFGRWYPSHYSFDGALTPACVAGGFTYMDQDALGVALILRAHATTGGPLLETDPVTSRYASGGYTNLAPVTIAGDNGGAPVPVTRLTNPAFPVMPNTALWTNGQFQINDIYSFVKLTPVPVAPAPDAGPFDMFRLVAALADPDGGVLIGTAAEQQTNATSIRHGRLRLQNAYGSELLALPVALEAQFWTAGGYYTTNLLDNCTQIPASSIVMDGWVPALGACETQLSPVGNLALAGGRYLNAVAPFGPRLTLTRPGAGNSGSVNLAINVGAAAAGNTCVAAAPSAATTANLPWFGPNLGAKATFGIYRSPLIYRRENY